MGSHWLESMDLVAVLEAGVSMRVRRYPAYSRGYQRELTTACRVHECLDAAPAQHTTNVWLYLSRRTISLDERQVLIRISRGRKAAHTVQAAHQTP